MADFLGMMKQAAQLQSKMQAMQEELGSVEVEAPVVIVVEACGAGLWAVPVLAPSTTRGLASATTASAR